MKTKKIEISADVRAKIMKMFGVSSRTVFSALNYSEEDGKTDAR